MRRIAFLLASLVLVGRSLPLYLQQVKPDVHMKGPFRKPAQHGWLFVHLEGTSFDMGFPHGYLLAPEIADAKKMEVLERTHDGKKGWTFLRDAAKNMMCLHIEAQFRVTSFLNAFASRANSWANLVFKSEANSRAAAFAEAVPRQI